MARAISRYPYLFSSIFLLIILILAGKIFLNPRRIRLVFLEGLASMPCFLFLLFFEGEYWNPARVGGGMVGIEDALISFAVGGWAWLVLLLSKRQKIIFDDPSREIHERFGLLAVISVALFLLFVLVGFQKMTSLILSNAIVGLFLFFRHGELRRLAIQGIWKFALFYFVSVKLIYFIWPDFVHQWNLSTFWGTTVLGIHLGECSWALVYGFFWPMFFGCLLNVKVEHIFK